ncbi:MAG TPA: ribosome silencing factor [Methylomirabilota bacterium]|nr:ribosome silencing factor [Methylomirabilota bacterium]
MDSTKLAELCRELADNRKAEDLIVLDLRKLSSITDYFVLCSGTSEPHLRAIVDEITETLAKDHGLKPRSEGIRSASWVVLDYFDVLVHVMRKDVREHYNLESLWGDAPKLVPGGAGETKPTEAKPKAAKKKTQTKKPGSRAKKVAED